MSLNFLNDYTRSIKMKIGDDPQPFDLIPDTNIDGIIMMQDKCFGCYTYGDTRKYKPTCEGGLTNDTITTNIEFFYMLHGYETSLNSTHYNEKTCLQTGNDTFDRCATLKIMGGNKASPRALFLKGHGFLGLGVGETQIGYRDQKLSALDQFLEMGLIDKKMFGIDTALTNSTNYNSTIRFGDIDMSKIPETHELKYI